MDLLPPTRQTIELDWHLYSFRTFFFFKNECKVISFQQKYNIEKSPQTLFEVCSWMIVNSRTLVFNICKWRSKYRIQYLKFCSDRIFHILFWSTWLCLFIWVHIFIILKFIVYQLLPPVVGTDNSQPNWFLSISSREKA